MLKFFRKIRWSLIKSKPAAGGEGNTRKYTLYAIGEIALVVIGILIALQINNWNEDRKDRITENTILESLLLDMEKNRRQVRRKIDDSQGRQEKMIANKQYFGFPPERLKDADVDSLLNALNRRTSFDPHIGTLNELINSGNLRVIKNGELRSLISSWSSKIDEVQEEEDLADVTINEYLIPYLMENTNTADWLNIDVYPGKLSLRNYNKVDNSKILEDLRFENLVNYSIFRRKWAIHRYSDMEEYLQEMIDIIKSELDGSDH